jgi:hypothetical protein
MLINELYAGRIVWNKVRMIKDPATGRRVPRPNRKDQYRSVDAPQLAIVEDATFKAAQVIKASRSHQGASQARKAVRPAALRILRRRYVGDRRAEEGEASPHAVLGIPRERRLRQRPQGFAPGYRDPGV